MKKVGSIGYKPILRNGIKELSYFEALKWIYMNSNVGESISVEYDLIAILINPKAM